MLVLALSACVSSTATPGSYRGSVDWEGLSGTIAFASGFGTLAILRTATRVTTTVATADGARIAEGSVALSPDAKRIAYAATKFDAPGARVYVMDVDGSDRSQLPCEEDNHCFFPVWSHDGTRVYYLRGVNGAGGVVSALPDGSEFDAHPLENVAKLAIAPSGDRFALAGSGERSIRVVFANGSDADRQVVGVPSGINPSWSPDGQRIAFVRVEAGAVCAVVIELAELATGVVATVARQAHACDRALMARPNVEFAPDGTQLLFNAWSDADAAPELYRVGLDGTGLRRVTQGGATGLSWVR